MKFMALGGAGQVGASCYYIQLAGMNLLFDCGKKVSGGVVNSPDYGSLLTSGAMAFLSQLDALFLSHGHFDHLGALPAIAQKCPSTPIYATGLTKALGTALLCDKNPGGMRMPALRMIQDELIKSSVMERIQTMSYGRSFTLGPLKVTFYEAGHVPGAAMIYLESPELNVLYTGDFKMEDTALTMGCHLPAHIKPDVMILCGLHAKHPGYREVNNLSACADEILRSLHRKQSVALMVQQLTKGVEAALYLQDKLPDTKLYIEPQAWQLAERMRQLNLAVWNTNCRPFPASPRSVGPGVFITSRYLSGCCPIKANFSLHATYDDCVTLIEACSPGVVFLVHSPPDRKGMGDKALQRHFREIQIIQPEQGRLYSDAE